MWLLLILLIVIYAVAGWALVGWWVVPFALPLGLATFWLLDEWSKR